MIKPSLAVRLMDPSERNMVLSNWKKDLFSTLEKTQWGVHLRHVDYWSLINHVLDRVTLPSAKIFIGHHPDFFDAPLCWAAVRDGELLYTYYRLGMVRGKDFSEADRATFREEFLRLIPLVAIKSRDFNPFSELERP